MTREEVAAVFRVDARTVTRWAVAGKLTSIRTLGGHRRYYRAEVDAIAAGKPLTAKQVKALRVTHLDGAL